MITIEKLKKENLKDVIKIYDQCFNTTTNINKSLNEFEKIYNNDNFHNIIAKDNDIIVGLASITIHYDFVEESKPYLTIWNVCVDKNHQRKKIATKLFDYIDEFAKDNNCSFISLITDEKNEIAKIFYEKMGYTKKIGYIKKITQ